MRIMTLFCLLTFFSNLIHAQQKVSKKEWQVTMFLHGFKAKGILKSVTDSSAIIIIRKNYTDEILFTDISKIKIRCISNDPLVRLEGFLIGGTTGGVIVGTLLSKNRVGEPRALAGIIGGIGGGIITGIASAIASSGITALFSHKRIIVQHDKTFLVALKQQLLPYSK